MSTPTTGAVDLIPKTGKLTTEVPDFIATVQAFLIKRRDNATVAMLEERVARDITVE